MTKEEAIKHLHTYSSTNGSGLTTQDQHEEAKKMAIKALETQLRWVPCGERLPSKYDNYLITTEDGMVVFGVYDPREEQWCRYDSIKSWWLYGIKVLAWQPLPTPYREGGQDNGAD